MKFYLLNFLTFLFLVSCAPSEHDPQEAKSDHTINKNLSFDSMKNDITNNISTVASEAPTDGKDAYEIMHVAFVGSPDIESIRPMLESVMETYGFIKTDDNRLKIGNMLVTLRQSSAVGVTEMDILKHIYQYGSNAITLPEQAGLSATLLETSK
jgi:hypothetical protein